MDPVNIEDLRKLAKKRVPKVFFDYISHGSFAQHTLRRNQEDFTKIKLDQKVMIDVSNRSTESSFLGQKARIPVGTASVGLTGAYYGCGEILTAQAAEEYGVPFTLSTMSVCSLEQVAAKVKKPFWFQLYIMKDRDYITDLIQRAKIVGCSVLVLTVDLQVLGVRYQDIRNGLSIPPGITLANILDISGKPRWAMSMLKSPSKTFGNLVGYLEKEKNKTDITSLSAWTADQFDSTLTWKDVEWVKNIWNGPLVIKGILSRTDAKAAVDSGADAIVVSNHGGRQLDSAPSAISVLPKIVEEVGDKTEVYFDSGITSGNDVIKALALGAKGTFIGKSFAYGLGAMGKKGVTKVFEILEKELSVSMGLTGVNSISEITPDILTKD